jgi:hypothetical protein
MKEVTLASKSYSYMIIVWIEYLKDKDSIVESYEYMFSEEDVKDKMNQVPSHIEAAMKYAFD